MQFQKLENSIGAENFIDASEWSSAWSNKWVAFADLIGFEAICDFPKTVTNVVLRYHRCQSYEFRYHSGLQYQRR